MNDVFIANINEIEEDITAELSLLHNKLFSTGWSPDSFKSLTNKDTVFIYVAINEQTKKIIGFIAIQFIIDEAEVLTLCVDKNFQKKGLGHKLCDISFTRLKNENIISVFLEVNQENQIAISLYKKLGFKLVSYRKGYYRKENALTCGDANIMRLTF